MEIKIAKVTNIGGAAWASDAEAIDQLNQIDHPGRDILNQHRLDGTCEVATSLSEDGTTITFHRTWEPEALASIDESVMADYREVLTAAGYTLEH